MKKLLTIGLTASLLAGCQNMQSGKLNTDDLEKIEMADVDEEQAKKIPVTYKARTVEEGLNALPFEMELPKKLPFEGEGFQPPSIMDMNHSGKQIMAEFRAFPKNKEENYLLMVSADYPVESFEQPNSEPIELEGGAEGMYQGNTLLFLQGKVQYTIMYNNKAIPKSRHKKELTEMANEMLK
jgi:hypothetical protein